MPSEEMAPGAVAQRQYPGHIGPTCRRDAFELEQEVLQQREGRHRLRKELSKLIAADDGRFAHSGRNPMEWLKLAINDNTKQAAHIYWAISRGCRFLEKGQARTPTASKNYFAAELAEFAKSEVMRQVNKGFLRRAGPGFKAIDILPLGSVPKPGAKPPVRIVCNGSKGSGGYNGDSVNDDVEHSYVELPQLRDTVKNIERGAQCAKADIQDWFVCIPLREDQFKHAVIDIDNERFYYAFLPLGIANSSRIAQAVGLFILDELRRQHAESPAREWAGGEDLYCDDFFFWSKGSTSAATRNTFAGAPESVHELNMRKAAAAAYLRIWLELMGRLGLPFDLKKKGKVVPPSTSVTYLGVRIDTIAMSLSIENDKVDTMLFMIDHLLQQQGVRLKEVEQLHGKLNWASCVLPGMQLLMFQLRQLLRKGYYRGYGTDMRIKPELRRDLGIIKIILTSHNGKSIGTKMHLRQLPFPLSSDGSTTGGGAFFGGHYLTMTWAESFESKDMGVTEARALRIALETWAPHLRNSHLDVIVDNQGLYYCLVGEKTKSQDQRYQEEMVQIALICISNAIVIHPHWWSSEENVLADAASRCSERGHEKRYRTVLQELTHQWRQQNDVWRWSDPPAETAETASSLLSVWRAALSTSA